MTAGAIIFAIGATLGFFTGMMVALAYVSGKSMGIDVTLRELKKNQQDVLARADQHVANAEKALLKAIKEDCTVRVEYPDAQLHVDAPDDVEFVPWTTEKKKEFPS